MRRLFFVFLLCTPAFPQSPPRGLLFYAKFPYPDDTATVRNPYILGALFQIYWSEVEPSQGAYDWSVLDRRIDAWKRAGKKAALRILWSTSGYWGDPSAKHPTPSWVWNLGAVKVTHAPSGTEIPLVWDPIYKRHAYRLLREMASRYDSDTGVLLLDMTPGAETNPYRFGTINDRDTSFPMQFRQAQASDGSSYSEPLWLSTVKEYVDSGSAYFQRLPLLVTLNAGAMPGEGSNQYEIGSYCVDAGTWVGQNGLAGSSYASSSPAKTAFLEWSQRSRNFFEMVMSTDDPRTGTLMEVMQAGARVNFSYLNVYPTDVFKGTPGHPDYDSAYENALRYGYQLLSGSTAIRTDRPGPAGHGMPVLSATNILGRKVLERRTAPGKGRR